jgi:hypothetical protein
MFTYKGAWSDQGCSSQSRTVLLDPPAIDTYNHLCKRKLDFPQVNFDEGDYQSQCRKAPLMNNRCADIVKVVTASLFAITMIQTPVAAANNLLVYWNFDQGGREMVTNLSGNGLDGSVGASWVDSPAGRAVMMNGTPKSIVTVNIPEDKRFGKESWTFMSMLRPIKFGIDGDQDQRRIFAFGKYPDAYIVIDIKGTGHLNYYFCYKNSTGETISAGGSSSIPLNENSWAHIAVVCDRQKKLTQTYVNGYCPENNRMPNDFDGDFVLDGRLTVGSGWQNYLGLVDEVKIYRSALTVDDIEAEFERLKDTFEIVESDEIVDAKKLIRQEKTFANVNAEWIRKRYDKVRDLCQELVHSSDAPAHFRSYAHLRIAQSYLHEGNRIAARATYLNIAKNESYPAVHSTEAERSARELETVSTNLAGHNANRDRTEVSDVGTFTAEVFVSTKGDDTNTGSMRRPFATMARARDEVRAIKKRGIEGPIVVTVMPGQYEVRESLALSTEDSGSASGPVIYRAREKVMGFPRGYYHSAFLPSVVYNKGLDLFLMVVGARPQDRFSGKSPILRMYWSDSPAGPWTEFYRDDNWRADSPENIPYQPKFIPKFTSADGKTMYMNYSDCSNRWKRHYVWNQQRFTLKLKTASDRRDK